ncbi:YcxB family protein [Acetobacteraceae bacterium H6797]|nr:YcxB family protein [Acetobacteraceae bacterium H6797]
MNIPPEPRVAIVALTSDDLLAAHALHLRTLLRQRQFRLLMGLYILALLGFIWWKTEDLIGLLATLLALPIVFWILLKLWRRWIVWRVRRQFADARMMRSEITYHWSEEGLSFESAYGTGHVPWEDFLDIRQDQSQALFYEHRFVYRLLPLRAMSEAQARDLRTCWQKARQGQ